MAKKLITISATIVLLLSQINVTLAQGDLYLNDDLVYFSSNYFVENVPVMVYASVGNNSGNDLLGTVKFWGDTQGVQISSDQPVSALSGQTDTVFVTWYPSPGDQQISVTVYPWESEGDDSGNNTVWKNVYVDYDTDGDGIGNSSDNDDDNDGYNDDEDEYPLDPNEWSDTDGDGVGDGADNDDDNDGVEDEYDDLPLDFDENTDTDGDGIGNNEDDDDDGDGITDTDEAILGTNPVNNDSDGDNCADDYDAFPLDPEECIDWDEDGIGDNADDNDDNDDLDDDDDENDHNIGPIIKISGIPLFPLTGQDLTIDASDSYDRDGSIMSCKWLMEEEEIEDCEFATTYEDGGKKTLSVTVTDDKGESRTQELEIYIYSLGTLIVGGVVAAGLIALAFYGFFGYNPARKPKVTPVTKKKASAKKKSTKKGTKKKKTIKKTTKK